MTTANTTPQTPPAGTLFRLPDPPRRQPEDMTTFKHLAIPGNAHYLIHHLGNQDATIITGEHYVLPEPHSDRAGTMIPDLLIAFDVNPARYLARNAYVISDQGKPPDFVLEIASPSTGRRDLSEKRAGYAALGIPEYWRFDETGRWHGARLAGDRLAAGQYQPINIHRLAEDILQGHSAVLNLNLRWERGQLGWYIPETGRHITTLTDERAGRIMAEARAENAEARAENAEARAAAEHESRQQAEARIRQLEAELNRRRNQ